MLQAGSQLVAVFEDSTDVIAVREKVGKLVLATLGTESAVHLEVSLGCVVVYITFTQGGLSGFDELANGLMAQGVQLSLIIDPESHTGFLASERLQGAHEIMCPPVLSCHSHKLSDSGHGRQLRVVACMVQSRKAVRSFTPIEFSAHVSAFLPADKIWAWITVDKPARLRYAGLVTVPVYDGESVA